MTQQQGPGLVEQLIDAGQARVVVTYDGRTGDLRDTVSRDATHDDVRRMVQEALRSGGVAGLLAIPAADLSGFVVDPCEPNETHPYHRLLVRPKTGFGGEHKHHEPPKAPPHVRPLGDRIFVQRKSPEERSAGGIIIPETAQQKTQEGRVLAVGSGKELPNGRRIEPSVKVGDRILFGKYAGHETKVDGEDQLFINGDDIFAVLED